MRMQGSQFLGWLTVAALVGLSGCGGKDESKGAAGGETPSLTGAALAAVDLAALRETAHTGYGSSNARTGGDFAAVFGGTSTSDVASYLDARAKYFVDAQDPDVSIEGLSLSDFLQQTGGMSVSGARIGAANIGGILWLYSELTKDQFGRPWNLTVHGSTTPVGSSRIGLVVMGDGYDPEFPQAFRQSILLHEARHSDCTGGLSQRTIDKIRKKESVELAGASCMHMHVICPPNHPLHDLPACDNESWGAYGIQLVYVKSILADDGIEDSAEYFKLQEAYSDTASRLLQGQSGRPDMSNEGVVP